jgi:hypothetical protein
VSRTLRADDLELLHEVVEHQAPARMDRINMTMRFGEP